MPPPRKDIRAPSYGSGSSSSSSANTASSPLLKWQERLQVFLKAERLMRRLPDAMSEDMGRCLKECDSTYTEAMWTAFYDEYSGLCGDYSAYRGNIFTPFISDALQEDILADALEGKRVILVDKDKMAKELREKYGVYSLSHWKKHLSLMRDPSPIDERGNDANASARASPAAIPAKRRLVGRPPRPILTADKSPSVQQIQQIQQSDPVIYTVEDDSPPPSPKIRPKREPAKTQGSAEYPPSFTKAELIEIFKSNEAWAPKIGDKSIKRVDERVFIEHLDRVHTDGAYFGYWLTMWAHYLKSEGIFK